MSKLAKQLSTASLLLGLVSLAWLNAQEPQHEGKSLTKWQNTLKSPDASLRWQAVEALGKLGQQHPRLVVESLAKAAQDPDLDVRLQAVAALTGLKRYSEAAVPALELLLKDQDSDLRRQTATALAAIGPFAEEAVPTLGQTVRDPNANVRLAAIAALQAIGPDSARAMDDLLASLQDKVPSVRRAAASALFVIAPQADPSRVQKALPVLVLSLRDNDPEVRRRATATLGRLGNDSEAVLAGLASASRTIQNPIRAEAAQALGQIGGKAIPALMANLQHNNSQVRAEAALALQTQGRKARPAFGVLARLLNDPEPVVRQCVRSALQAIDPDPVDVLPLLKKSLENQDVTARSWAIAWLGAIALEIEKEPALEAISLLTMSLSDADATNRQQAASYLGSVGVEAKSALPQLRKLIDDADAGVRLQAAYALSRIDKQAARETIPILIKALADVGRRSRGGPPVNQSAASALAALGEVEPLVQALEKSMDEATTAGLTYALVNMGPKAKGAFKFLQGAIQSRDAGTRQRSAEALQAILPDAKEAVPVLIESLRHEDDYIRRWATIFLSQLGQRSPGPDVNASLGSLTNALKTEATTEMRILLIRTLVEICANQNDLPKSPLDVEIIRTLVSRLNDINSSVRLEATAGLGRIGAAWRGRGPTREAVPTLLESLNKGRPFLREAANALGQMGDLPPLIVALKTANHERVRAGAAYAIAIIGPQAYEQVPALIEACQDADPHVRHEAVLALGAIGRLAAQAVPVLIKALNDPDYVVPPAAAFALGQMGPDATPACEALAKALTAPAQELRNRAQAALVAIGPASVPAIREQLKSSDVNTKLLAIQAIKQIGPKAREAIPELLKVFDQPNWSTRYAASEAITTLKASVPAAIPALTMSVSSNDLSLALQAVNLLHELHADSPNTVTAMAKRLEQSLNQDHNLLELHLAIVVALSDLGPRAQSAVPVLLANLDEPQLTTSVAKALQNILAPNRKGAELVQQLKSMGQLDERQLALVLGSTDAGTVPTLIEFLTHKRARVRLAAISSLQRLGVLAKPAEAALLKAIQDENKSVRLKAITALAVQPRPEMFNLLAPYLKHWDDTTRVEVALLMANLLPKEQGVDAQLTLQVLFDAVKAESSSQRQSLISDAIHTLAHEKVNLRVMDQLSSTDLAANERIIPLMSIIENQDSTTNITDLAKALQDRHLSIRQKAAETLNRLSRRNADKPAMQKIVPVLEASLKERDRTVRVQAALALWNTTQQSSKTLPVLLNELAFHSFQNFELISQLQSGSVFEPLLTELANMANKSEEARSAIVAAISHENQSIQQGAVVVVGLMKNPPGGLVGPALIALQDNSNPTLRRWSVIALRALSTTDFQQAPGVMPGIMGALKDRDANAKREALKTLGHFGPKLESIRLNDLLAMLNDPDRLTRLRVLETLGQFGLKASPAIAAIQRATKDRDATVRRFAMTSLGQIGVDALPALKQSLTALDWETRTLAAESLGRLGPVAKDALPTLREVTNDHDPDVVQAAQDAIIKITTGK